MIQKCIELGEGYADIYELIELAKRMPERIEHFVAIHTTKEKKQVTSLALVMKPTREGNFQPIYICLEGIPTPDSKKSKRYDLFENVAQEYSKQIKSLTVKPSNIFHERSLYYQHLIGILQMNHLVYSNA
ncbi:methylthioribose kinase [Aquibacillus koreensis]|uniref:Methylthioribose kinase n=1 Tax=Aquibacillus koreensis TaxID=279446 RepID=A0A9X3WL47_9BACI|nr:methylthioribose kinase [Aquibacillus koreensis]MCT2538080.1 methylthioribose kinase [Aquibacillus koreensis]MDC3420603.1 methylthioribose kinase [Aquibacillus koreensis]